ncbi:MAG: methyltransferase domain-containing protein [Candidatus Omnitrophica bacterium]|nr:methyltransferase domain-containing protein [Candidatus Omnitrophota bacterium]
MGNQKVNFKTEKDLQEAILQEKVKGISDLEIGQKYAVTFRYIERLITKTQGLNISTLKVSKKIRRLHPKDFKEEKTTVWSFKQRGNWATHSGEYRGNWSPYIPRNVILKYSKPGELVLDYFCGAGTTAVESKLLRRRCIALDINDKAIELAKKNVDFNMQSQELTLTSQNQKSHLEIYEPKLMVGDARDLLFIEDNSIDLICAHPPYANIIHYTDSKEGDLSFFDIDMFIKEMSKVARESFRVLKPGRQCAILIGDMRSKKHVIPLGFKLINVYLNAGFQLRELVIKRQHNCKTTGFWYANSIKYNFLLLAHEYLPIFEKPAISVPVSGRERTIDYGLLIPSLEKPLLKIKLDKLETTTVWILPEKDFEKHLNRNVIDRYSNGDGYSIISLITHSKDKIPFFDNEREKNKALLFIKSPFLDKNSLHLNIDLYLQKVKEIVNRQISTITSSGFIVIQTQDIRKDRYVEPLAKRLVDELTNDNLWLKEIVVVTQDRASSSLLDWGDHLKIVHQYLLIYELRK